METYTKLYYITFYIGCALLLNPPKGGFFSNHFWGVEDAFSLSQGDL